MRAILGQTLHTAGDAVAELRAQGTDWISAGVGSGSAGSTPWRNPTPRATAYTGCWLGCREWQQVSIAIDAEPEVPKGMAKLILSRPRQFPDMHRPYEVVLDGDRVASIGGGMSLEVPLTPGLHQITARMGPLFQSRPLRLDVGTEGDYHFEIRHALTNRRLLAIAFALFVWPALAPIIVLAASAVASGTLSPPILSLPISLFVGCSPALLLMIAAVTTWRDRYLDFTPIPAVGQPVLGRVPGRRWRPRLSVRGLMLAVLIIGTLLGWNLQRARVQREAVSAIRKAGGTVRYRWQSEPGHGVTRSSARTWWESLMNRLGPDYFASVVWVGFYGGQDGEPDDGVMAHIAKLDGLEVLDFCPLDFGRPGIPSHRSVTDAGLGHLRKLPQLQHLNLNRTGVRGPGLAQLRGTRRLRWLELRELPIRDDDLVHLQSLPSLEIVKLSSNRITDEGLAHLSNLTTLKQLHLESRSVTSAGLRHLSRRTELGLLYLNSPRIDSLLPLERLTRLIVVTLKGTAIGDADLAIIARSKDLLILDVSDTQIGDVGLSHLAGLSNLHNLDLSNTRITDAGLASLTGLSQCRSLRADRTGVTDDGVALLSAKLPAMKIWHRSTFDREATLAELRAMRQPKELKLTNILLRDDDLVDLEGATSLESLALRSDGITDDGLSHLVKLTNLRSLDLAARSITGGGLRHLRGMTHLRKLTLRSPKIGSLVEIKPLAGLEALDLDDTSIDDDDLAIVAGIKGLKVLSLAYTRIGDAGLARLAGLGGLDRLELRGTRITDAGLAALTDLSKCTYLGVEQTGVTPEGIASLSARFPMIRISH